MYKSKNIQLRLIFNDLASPPSTLFLTVYNGNGYLRIYSYTKETMPKLKKTSVAQFGSYS